MKMIGELYSPDIALLPIGSVYTMDIDHAVLAAKWLNAKKVIPMHYNTFGAINVNIKEFEEKIKSQNIQPIILKSGEETIF
jgi:L-ascorbate metabolism protein UlaG (beta-lactamase superfamily)